MSYPPRVPPAGYPGMPPLGPLDPVERIRIAWQRRPESDYVFDFWSALGWTLLSCGIYWLYVFYRMMERDREHNRRRLELLEAANDLAWARAQAAGIAEELRPSFERTGAHLAVLRQMTTEFRDPVIWLVIAILANIAELVGYVFIDQDLVKHESAETALEAELAAIYARLGETVAPAPPPYPKQAHNYVARIIVTVITCGFYGFWWGYDIMVEGNRHFERNWVFEDSLAAAAQRMR